MDYHTVKDSIPSLLLLLLVLNSPLHALDKRFNGLAAAQRHGAAPDGTTILDLETQSLSDHRKAAISQSNCEAAQTLLQLR